MRLIFLTISIIISSNTFSQRIALEKLLSFYYKNVSLAENYLQSGGYVFRNKQTFQNSKEVQIYWDNNTQGQEHYVNFTVDTVRQIITSISYEFYTSDEYLELLNLIPKLKFNDTKPLIYRADGTAKEFDRDDVNILLSTTKYDADKFHYTITICNCFYPR